MPNRRELADAAEDSGRPGEAPIPPAVRASLRLLIVDDDRTLREGLVVTLRAEGYDVSSAASGEEGLAALQRARYDVVITDLHMHPVSGSDVLRAARATQPDAVIVVITGDPSLPACLEVVRAGAWDCLPKPFSAAYLQHLLARAANSVLQVRNSRKSRDAMSGRPPVTAEGDAARQERLVAEFERVYVERLVGYARGNLDRAARLARIDRPTLETLIEKHALA